MAPPHFARRWPRRSRSTSTRVVKRHTHKEEEQSVPARHIPTERLGIIVLHILIMACSIAILILSVFGIAAFHGKTAEVYTTANPPFRETGTFPRGILLCSLCLSIFGIMTVLYRGITYKTERYYNPYAVFALYILLFCWSVGAIIGYGTHAAEGGYFEGIKVFYCLIGFIIALLVITAVYMILSGNPFAKHRSQRKSVKTSYDEENTLSIDSPVILAPGHIPISHDRVNDSPRSKNGRLTQPDPVHYNSVDPYHPLRMNPPNYGELMEMPPRRAAPREQNSTAQTEEPIPAILDQGLQATALAVYREPSCILRWMSWSRDGE